MSWEAVTWANKQKLKKCYEQAVLLVLANCADPNGEAFVKWPGRDHWWIYLSERTRLPKSSLFRHLNTLVALGLGERTMQVLADGSRRPTFKLNLNATFDIDLPEDFERYQAAFTRTSAENESPVETEHADDPQGDENDSDISHSQNEKTPLPSQSPVETRMQRSQSPVETDPFPVLRLQEDSLPCSKDSPLPPSGGLRAVDELWDQFVKAWGEPIQRMVIARSAWDRIATDRRPEVLACAKGYWAWLKAHPKRPAPQSAQSFLRDAAGWAQWLRYTPSGDGPPVSIADSYPLTSAEGLAIIAAYEIAGCQQALRSFMIRAGASGKVVNYLKPVTPRLLALSKAERDREAWPVLNYEQAGSWDSFLREIVTVQTRNRLREGARAPWPWPPGKDGKLYPAAGPPAAGLSDRDAADLQ